MQSIPINVNSLSVCLSDFELLPEFWLDGTENFRHNVGFLTYFYHQNFFSENDTPGGEKNNSKFPYQKKEPE